LSWTTIRGVTPVGRRQAKGLVLGGEGRVSSGLLTIRLGYAQGSTRESGARSLFVEGFGLLGIAPVPGLELGLGPHIRSRVIAARRQRLVFWRIRARYEGEIVEPGIRAYIEATAGKPDFTTEAFSRWWGGSAGLLFRPRDLPVGGGVSYSIDETRAGPGNIRETVEAVTLMLNVYLR
jgi:hypothetical protein